MGKKNAANKIRKSNIRKAYLENKKKKKEKIEVNNEV